MLIRQRSKKLSIIKFRIHQKVTNECWKLTYIKLISYKTFFTILFLQHCFCLSFLIFLLQHISVLEYKPVNRTHFYFYFSYFNTYQCWNINPRTVLTFIFTFFTPTHINGAIKTFYFLSFLTSTRTSGAI